LAKRLTAKEKKEIINLFTNGRTIDYLSKTYNCTKLTISRNLKKYFGDDKFKLLKINNKSLLKDASKDKKKTPYEIENNSLLNNNNDKKEQEFSPLTEFFEITPLNFEIENATQKDLSSIPIADVKFPNIAYMIVDNKIELQIKYLKDYPDWQFLAEDELNRKTIEIYEDLKYAKRLCKKEQKVIKVPNTNVFRIVAPFLLSRGISRIINNDKLIAL